MTALILLVHADSVVLQRLEAVLLKEGHAVATATSFKWAKQLLSSIGPDLLVADVRLGAFNGLGLALRAQLDHADLPVIITDSTYDPVLEREATSLGVVYVVNPLQNAEFLSNVKTAVDAHAGEHPPRGGYVPSQHRAAEPR